MKKFTSVVESNDKKYYKITSEIQILVESNSEGEACYISDSELGKVENHLSYTIKNVEEITKSEFDSSNIMEQQIFKKIL